MSDDKTGIKTGTAIENEIPGNEKIKTEVKKPCQTAGPISIDYVNGLMCAFEMFGHIQAAQARIEAMNVANVSNTVNGHNLKYIEEDFKKEADNIESYARYLRTMRKVGVEKFNTKYSEGVVTDGN